MLAGLGLGGLGLLGQPVSANRQKGERMSQDQISCDQPWYDWDCSVDAHENGLRNVGKFSFIGQTTPLTSVTGENLSIDNDGALNASVGPGFGASGDFVSLQAFTGPRFFGNRSYSYWQKPQQQDELNGNPTVIIPFDDLGAEGMSQIYLSIGVQTGEWDTLDNELKLRLYDEDIGEPVPDSILRLTGDAGPNKTTTSDKTPYDPEEPRTMAIQVKTPDNVSSGGVELTNIFVWGGWFN